MGLFLLTLNSRKRMATARERKVQIAIQEGYIDHLPSNVPYDGGIIVCRTAEDLDTLSGLIRRKQLYICKLLTADQLNRSHIDLATSCKKQQLEYLMVVSWKVSLEEGVVQYAQEQQIPLVHNQQPTVDEIIRMVVDMYKQLKLQHKQQWVNWKPVAPSGSHLTVWGRLKPTLIKKIAKEGCTHLVSILGTKEKPQSIGTTCKEVNITWIWLDVPGAKQETLLDHKQLFIDGLNKALDALRKPGRKLCIHCAAGIHRTGTFTYALLRNLGYHPDEANELLYEIRPVTQRQIGQFRMDFAENHLVFNQSINIPK